jgi:putative redox protein
MAEAVIVRQNKDFSIGFWVLHAEEAEEPSFHSVKDVYQLSPYSMLLTSLGSCTTILLHTYAQHHNLDLQEVELRLRYDRVFDEDCQHCEEIERFEEVIEESFLFIGDLTEGDRKKLFQIAKQCPIYKMLHDGVQVKSQIIDAAA